MKVSRIRIEMHSWQIKLAKRRSRKTIFAVLLAALALFPRVTFAAEATASDFRWPQLTIYAPSSPGSGFDLYARLLGRHIGEYLPGNPNVVIVNKLGAGGLTMTNYVYNSAAKDGTEIGTSAPSFMTDRLLKGANSEARFDATRFNWVGSMSQNHFVLLVSKASGLTLQDLLHGKKAYMGAAGTAGSPWIFGHAMNNLMDTNINILPAYPGEAEVLLGIEEGELDGIPAVAVETIKALRPQWLHSEDMPVLMQFAQSRMAEFQDVPNVLEMITDADNRETMNEIAILGLIGRPFFAPPGVPEERLKALRKAFDAAMSSPELKADSAKSNIVIEPVPGVEVAKIIERLNSPSETVLKKLRGIFADQ